MASNDYDRPMVDRPLDPDMPPRTVNSSGTWTGPVGMVLAILFVILMMLGYFYVRALSGSERKEHGT